MSFGKMNTKIKICKVIHTIDKDGFTVDENKTIATVSAYMEQKNTTEKWTNRAVLLEASALFVLRHIPKAEITTDMVILCDEERYNIVSVENVRGRKMYLEIIAKLEGAENGKN